MLLVLPPNFLVGDAQTTPSFIAKHSTQVGVLAAPALLSLRVMTKRLGEDHTRAKALAEGLAKVPGIEVDPASVQSNIVMFHIAKTGLTGQEFVKAVAAHGVKVSR